MKETHIVSAHQVGSFRHFCVVYESSEGKEQRDDDDEEETSLLKRDNYQPTIREEELNRRRNPNKSKMEDLR